MVEESMEIFDYIGDCPINGKTKKKKKYVLKEATPENEEVK